MNKVLIGFTAFVASLALFASPAFASSQNWDVSGPHVIHYVLNSTDYPNDASLTQVGTTLTGTLGYPSGASPYLVTGTLTGTISGDTIDFTVQYSDRSYLRSDTGTIAPDGTVSGDWNDANPPTNDKGTWSLSGKAVPVCTQTGFLRDGINMTALWINPTSTISGDIDAMGCNIGVYYGPTYTGSGLVNGANIHGSNYYGIVVQQASVDVKNSNIHNIGENPFNGSQHGIGIYYANVEGKSNGDCTKADVQTTGTIDNNQISTYQKGGIVVACPGANVTVTNNTVTGNEEIPYIAQNGIQFGYGARGEIRGNEITGNYYQGASWTSTGLLLFNVNANEVKRSNNIFRKNQTNLNTTTEQACPKMYGGVYEGWGLCTIY